MEVLIYKRDPYTPKIAPDAETGRHYADKLVKVWRINRQDSAHCRDFDMQGGKEPAFPERMFIYNCRLADRYNRTVASMSDMSETLAELKPSLKARSHRIAVIYVADPLSILWAECTIVRHSPVFCLYGGQ